MLVSKEYYFLNFLLVYLAFYLFVFIISIFGFIFFYYIRSLDKKDWDVNFLEKFIICFAIGISVYISISFILDLFHFYNFYSAYLSLIILDALFIWYLIYKGKLNASKFIDTIKDTIKEFKHRPKQTITLIIILFVIIFLQIWIQWGHITKEYAIPSRDTYTWLGHSWHLLENGYLWRERMPVHYPMGYVFFLAGPELIYPNWEFSYFYMKFAGIPFFSFYIIVLFAILKNIFKKNYMILIGLSFTLISNYLFARFSVFTSSTIPTLLILIGIVFLISRCPFYLNGFLISAMFLTNALFGLFYLMALTSLLIMRFLTKDKKLRTIFKDDIAKSLIILAILLIPYIFHTLLIHNINFLDFIYSFVNASGLNLAIPKKVNTVHSFDFLLQFKYVLRNTFPHNDIVYVFLDLERRMLSFFIIFPLITLFIPAEKYFNKKFSEIINFGKISLIIIIVFYTSEYIFEDTSSLLAVNIAWFKFRAVEAFIGPIIILSCFAVEKVIENSKMLTNYLINNSSRYRKLRKNKFLSSFLKIENILLSFLLISAFSILNAHERIYISYYFEQEEIDTIFYIKENVPKDSKILVNFYDGMGDALHSLLSTYQLYDWEFSEDENDILGIKEYIKRKNIRYVLLDLSTLNSTELYNFTSDYRYDKLFQNDVHILLKYY